MAFELGPLVEAQEAMVRPRHLPRHRELATADQADVGDRVVWGAERLGGDTGGLAAGQARDTVDAGGLEGLIQRRIRQDGGQAAGRYRPLSGLLGCRAIDPPLSGAQPLDE
jgi:hypothetical protein